jgi:outer membrane protein OmpA-like peptidoglycan-associated protein
MKIVATILIGLLIVTLGGGAYFYLYEYKPVKAEYEKLSQGQPEFERTRKELTQLKAKEKQVSAWIGPVMDTLKKGLAKEITAGTAEIVASDNRIIVNIAEGVLYTPLSVTFAKDSRPSLDNLAALLKEFKDKEIVVGNMTKSAPAQGKGRKKVPARDARTLASARSLELVKYLEKNGAPSEALIAASYPAKIAERGFRIKDQKTIIVISAPVSASPLTAAPKPEAKTTPATQPTATPVTKLTTTTEAPPSQLKSIPISTVPPKKTQ